MSVLASEWGISSRGIHILMTRKVSEIPGLYDGSCGALYLWSAGCHGLDEIPDLPYGWKPVT
jgi:hypothetical protein